MHGRCVALEVLQQVLVQHCKCEDCSNLPVGSWVKAHPEQLKVFGGMVCTSTEGARYIMDAVDMNDNEHPIPTHGTSFRLCAMSYTVEGTNRWFECFIRCG